MKVYKSAFSDEEDDPIVDNTSVPSSTTETKQPDTTHSDTPDTTHIEATETAYHNIQSQQIRYVRAR